MKNFIISLNIIIVFLFIFTTSCRKYEEGPLISLQTKKERLVRTWDLVSKHSSLGIGEMDVSGSFTFIKDGTGSYDYQGDTSSITWEFGKNKKYIEVNRSSSDYIKSYEILRLTEDELWLLRYQASELITEKYSARN